MATIEKRTAKDAKVSYRARVRILGQPERTKTFARKTDAANWAKAIETDFNRGEYVPTQEAMKRTVSDMIDKYIQDTLPNKPRNKDKKKVESLLKWWKDEIGVYKLAKITPAIIVDARDKLSRGKTRSGTRRPATVNRYLAAISHVFSTAMREWHWINNTPMRQVIRKEESKGRIRFLSDDERKALLKACKESSNPHLYTIVVLAISTGARRGEIVNLTWDQVDLKNNRIVLHDTKNRDRRVLPLAGEALKLIKEKGKVRHINKTLLFPGNDPDKPADFKEAWMKALVEASIEDFRFHDLRHSAASYLAMNGATLAEIAEILGHKTLQMVKRYSHLTEQHTAKVVDRMNREIFK